MVSEALDIQVLVRAMYDYESEDATNLSFKKDDVIQVLAQLESGWWAGHCDGRQGWFPSNYVQVLGEEDLDSQEDDPDAEADDIDAAGGDSASTTTDPAQAAAVRKPSAQSPGSVQEPVEGLPQLPQLPNPFEPEPSWQSLSDHTTAAIDNLLASADKGYKPYYLIQSSIVVEAIRVMLYASGTVDKDSTIMRQHRALRLQHRQIMAALSKLVLSAKMASSVWPAADAVPKLQADAQEVKTAAQNYITTAMASDITVHQVDARLVTDVKSPLRAKAAARSLDRALSNASLRADSASPPGDRKLFGAQLNSQSILSQLDYYSKSATKAVNVLSRQLEKVIDDPVPTARNNNNTSGTVNGAAVTSPIMNTAQSAQLVTQARHAIAQLGSLLSLVTDFYTSFQQDQSSGVPEKFFADVRTGKQALHGSTASLVMAIQSVTDLLAVGQTLDLALNTTLGTEKAITSLVQTVKALIQERDAADSTGRTSFDPYAGAGARKGSIAPPGSSDRTAEDIMYGHDNDSDIEPDMAPRPVAYNIPPHHRNRSDSQPSVFSAGSSTAYTPSTEYTRRNEFPFATSPSESSFNIPPTTPGRADPRGEKLRKILGDEAPGRPSAQQWFLCYDYQPGDLILNAEGQVKGGTITALIERLTLHDGLDPNFIATFLLTYRSFTTTNELFTQLFTRFTIQPPMGLTPEEADVWNEKKQTPIRLRVFNIIKSWLETYYLEDEVDDRDALSMIKEFSESAAMKDTMSFAAVQLIKLVEKREQSEGAFRKMVLNLATQAPQPIVPRNLKKIKFLELDPLEFARQLTIMEATIYNKIRPVECLAKAWTSNDPDIAAKAVTIKKMIETSNLYANWIDELILSEKEIKKRVLVIRHFVLIAEKLRALNNFSMLSATMAALSQSPIYRLKRTWEQVPNRTMTSLMELQQLMGVAKNWADYREELHNVNPPCVPFVGMYLTDLVMIQDGNPDFLKKSNTLVNFYKRVKTAEVIREIQQYQSVPYCLTAVPEIQAFIRRGMDSTKSDEELYNMSLQLEPRESGDEKIARLLTESGML
ncbi:hypothetical protein BGX31_005329 [Mortierella sp. GBA43]|nr:hypothetical protein BGX31_005329 [Mortierella sp. GBA43]